MQMYVDSCFLSMVLVGACMVLVLYTYDVGIIQVLFYQKKMLPPPPMADGDDAAAAAAVAVISDRSRRHRAWEPAVSVIAASDGSRYTSRNTCPICLLLQQLRKQWWHVLRSRDAITKF